VSEPWPAPAGPIASPAASARPVALITGGQQGIGAATAAAFARAGHDVMISWLDDEAAAQRVIAAVTEAGGRGAALRADLRDVGRIGELAAQTLATFGRIDVLVNNAGVFPRSSFLDLTPDEWDLVQAVNLRGAAFCSQAAARAMIGAGARGSIVTIGSRAMAGVERGAHYAASKAGLAGLTRSMALELAPYGIRANAVAAGMTDTAQAKAGGTPAELAARAAGIPLGRMAHPAEIAAAAVFLASDQASFITGEILQVNGGAYLS
jgi:3-oxoacyl-[acyl-carrier protein] reductase